MFEIACVVSADIVESIAVLRDALKVETRPEFDDDLPETYRWLYDILDPLPVVDDAVMSKCGTKLFCFWSEQIFDVEGFALAISNQHYQVFGYFYRHYEDVGCEDDPMPNGVFRLFTDNVFLDCFSDSSRAEVLSTKKHIFNLKKQTHFR